MSSKTSEIKNNLQKMITETDDEIILSKVQAYFATLKSKNTDLWDTISYHEKNVVNTGLEQLEKGEVIPHEKVKMKVDQIFGRK